MSELREGPKHPVSADAVVDRLREALGAGTDGELATKLGLGSSAPSNWRSRNAPPYAICAQLAAELGISLDWLIFGRGPMRVGELVAAADGLAGMRTDAARRISQFVKFWDASRDADESVWLEQQIKRAVPEYGEWLAAGGPRAT